MAGIEETAIIVKDSIGYYITTDFAKKHNYYADFHVATEYNISLYQYNNVMAKFGGFEIASSIYFKDLESVTKALEWLESLRIMKRLSE